MDYGVMICVCVQSRLDHKVWRRHGFGWGLWSVFLYWPGSLRCLISIVVLTYMLEVVKYTCYIKWRNCLWWYWGCNVELVSQLAHLLLARSLPEISYDWVFSVKWHILFKKKKQKYMIYFSNRILVHLQPNIEKSVSLLL